MWLRLAFRRLEHAAFAPIARLHSWHQARYLSTSVLTLGYRFDKEGFEQFGRAMHDARRRMDDAEGRLGT